jgi:hypothetical protein
MTKGVILKIEKINPMRKTKNILRERERDLSSSQKMIIKAKLAAAEKLAQKKAILPAKIINSLLGKTSKRKEDTLHKKREKV